MAYSTVAPPSTSINNTKKDLDVSAFSYTSPASFQLCKRSVSKKICSVTSPSERKPATTGLVKTGMTMTEKILARASEKTHLSPGDNVWVNIDVLMTHDVCGPGSFGIFKKEFGQNAKANPDYKGVCHVALAQEGHCRPGEVLLGTDSHTCTAGAFGQFATGIGITDAGFVLGTGKLLLKVPPTLRFVLDGEMPDYLLAKDLILQIIGEISVAGATYKAMEFVGSTVESLSPHSPDNHALARECKDVKIDRVYIGSCTGGKTEDFMAAVRVFLASVWMDVYSLPVPGSGGKTCSQIFEEAGCDTPASPTCGACMGGPKDTYARLNEPQVCVSTTNRNFPGRMGHKEGQIYLASPYTAAAWL
ncbi:hypothetical protein ACLB2K_041332 [Fragaria x ananassa]